MADAPKEGGDTQALLIFFGLLGGLIFLWWFSGGPSRADLRGMFLSPPAPVGTGEAYGPDVLPQKPYQAQDSYSASSSPSYQSTDQYNQTAPAPYQSNPSY